MARKKKGLEFFPVDIDICQDPKVSALILKHGTVAFAILVQLFATIYKNGYYLEWTETNQLAFFRQLKNVRRHTFDNVMQSITIFNLFDHEMFVQHGILTSKGIQERYFYVLKKTKKLNMCDMKYVLIDLPERMKPSEEKLKEVAIDKKKVQADVQKTGETETETKTKTETKTENIEDKSSLSLSARAREKAFEDDLWLETLGRLSGLPQTRRILPELMDLFDTHLIASSRSSVLSQTAEYKRYFANWWRFHGYKSPQELAAEANSRNGPAQGNRFRKRASAADIDRLVAEALELGMEDFKTEQTWTR